MGTTYVRCPIPGCDEMRSTTQVMCKDHWFRVSKPTRDRVYDEYGRKPYSPAHLAAVRDAKDEASRDIQEGTDGS